MSPNALTTVDHLMAITDYLVRVHPELSRDQAYVEALIAYRRYGMRIDDIPNS